MKKSAPAEVTQPPEPITVGSPTQLIYADRILNMAVGPAITKLTLALEIGENTFNPFAQLVLPTQGLIQAIDFLHTAMHKDDALKRSLTEGLDKFKAELAK